jgi:GNAT superfamily N-acetyltransferase
MTKATLSKAASWRPVLQAHDQEDAGWNWPAIVHDYRAAARAGEGVYEFITLQARGGVQALMILDTQAHLGRRTGRLIVYVEYLAVAPWNRETIQSPRRYSGCGRSLLKFAIQKSDDLGCDGRVGLHSLPGSRAFYAGLGFKDLGPDGAEGGLHYFEYPD